MDRVIVPSDKLMSCLALGFRSINIVTESVFQSGPDPADFFSTGYIELAIVPEEALARALKGWSHANHPLFLILARGAFQYWPQEKEGKVFAFMNCQPPPRNTEDFLTLRDKLGTQPALLEGRKLVSVPNSCLERYSVSLLIRSVPSL
jgi:hypothetical protein